MPKSVAVIKGSEILFLNLTFTSIRFSLLWLGRGVFGAEEIRYYTDYHKSNDPDDVASCLKVMYAKSKRLTMYAAGGIPKPDEHPATFKTEVVIHPGK
jgi:hypothetical protein